MELSEKDAERGRGNYSVPVVVRSREIQYLGPQIRRQLGNARLGCDTDSVLKGL